MKKQKLGTVLYSNENSAKVKLESSKKRLNLINYQGNKDNIITANNYIGAKTGQCVCIEFNNIISFKLIYILYIQPIIFALLGLLIGFYMAIVIKQPSLLYEVTFSCIVCTIAIIYKDYYKEKNKDEINIKPDIIKIL
ncbi:SoxR reducing system RseC family protein [Paraclostridium bifermentans]|jgi:sigma-E factor negative regulatory protein RseC|uniref:SoxR reducing system RseC family protein n=1 Tax=Paraclostridium bifermentans TaxID=1490 RepID=UPI00290DC163|nr:SoxR reducing system RseC family protein [Paraclostridium bifermentans]MDU3335150.1 SoxR reducing system RseC family protein [Paraclostridium bifermentans]